MLFKKFRIIFIKKLIGFLKKWRQNWIRVICEKKGVYSKQNNHLSLYISNFFLIHIMAYRSSSIFSSSSWGSFDCSWLIFFNFLASFFSFLIWRICSRAFSLISLSFGRNGKINFLGARSKAARLKKTQKVEFHHYFEY